MSTGRAVVIGAGIAGLTAAVALAARGLDVTVVERCGAPGGKMRQVRAGGNAIDAGPTVLTLPQIFEEIFARAGASFADYVTLQPLETLARHTWPGGGRLDLFADIEHSAQAIGELAGAAEARGYHAFCERARRIYDTLSPSFIRAQRPTPAGLALTVGLHRLGELGRISPFTTLWRELGRYFRDPRLRQLFGRYATYMGSSPFAAPATLMLIAHVERQGVWHVAGGMQRIAAALAALAQSQGAVFRYGESVASVDIASGRAAGVTLASGERLAAEAVVCNADVAALAGGCFGAAARRAVPAVPRSARSLSAVTWGMSVRAGGFPLVRHTVFFNDDYAAEFRDIFEHRRLPASPTVYVCAQDRDAPGGGAIPDTDPERLFCLVNAPPNGDAGGPPPAEIQQCEQRALTLLARCGLRIEPDPETTVITTPRDFERLFPGTGGALYGPVSHGWRASFQRPGSRSRIPRLYLAGGGAHPGAGVPMAALSGSLAAASLIEDLASTTWSRPAATLGGTSTG